MYVNFIAYYYYHYYSIIIIVIDIMSMIVANICYDLGPSVGTWVLPITHGTWRSRLSGKISNGILKIGVTRICC